MYLSQLWVRVDGNQLDTRGFPRELACKSFQRSSATVQVFPAASSTLLIGILIRAGQTWTHTMNAFKFQPLLSADI